jgi:hypothetical protein
MKTLGRNPIAKIVLGLNLLFWIVFIVAVGIKAVPFTDHPPEFEEELPAFKFGRWAMPVEMESQSVLLKTIYTVYFPSYRPLAGVTNWITTEKTWVDRIGPLSIGSYVLVGTMLLSFIQWYVVAILLWRMVASVRKIGPTAPIP